MPKTSTSKGSRKAQLMKDQPGQRLYDLKSAAQYLGHTLWGIRTLVWRGEIPVVKSGRKQYLDRFDMDAWIKRNKVTIL